MLVQERPSALLSPVVTASALNDSFFFRCPLAEESSFMPPVFHLLLVAADPVLLDRLEEWLRTFAQAS